MDLREGTIGFGENSVLAATVQIWADKINKAAPLANQAAKAAVVDYNAGQLEPRYDLKDPSAWSKSSLGNPQIKNLPK